MAQSGRRTILVTGGGGYIGTHCIVELLQQDYNVVAIDNYTNAVKGNEGKFIIFSREHGVLRRL
jgi:nucleoside-diphosphate-sugar epimerase